MATQKSKEGFHVKLDGIELSEASLSRIQSGIQEVVLRELAGYYPNPDDPGTGKSPLSQFEHGVVLVPPRFWWGFILRKYENFGNEGKGYSGEETFGEI